MKTLTVRERLVLTWLAKGYSVKEVAYTLGVSRVNACLIYRKLGATDRRDAIRIAVERRLLNDYQLYCIRELRAEVERLRSELVRRE